MRMLVIAAAAVLFAGAAYAQSAVQNPSVPGSGYQTPPTQQTGTPTTSGLATPGQSGSGYKAPDKPSPTAPNAPASRDGNPPKGGKDKAD